MRIKGVIFDFNGTLFWDTELHNRAWDIFLNKHALALTKAEKYARIHGRNNEQIMHNLFGPNLSKAHIKSLAVEKEDIYQQLCLRGKMELAPGAIDFITFLKQREVPFTIATASDLHNVDFYFDQFNLARYFDKSKIVYNDGQIKAKPDPEIYLTAMEKIDASSDECLIFEDSFVGITAAEQANAKKIVIVRSTNDEFQNWHYQKITHFAEVDRSIF